MKPLFALILTLATITVRAEVILADTTITCMDRTSLLALLDRYLEQPLIRGRTEDNGAVVIYTNPSTLTYTVVERVENLYCLLASGTDFAPVPRELRQQFLEQRSKRYN